MKKQPKWYAVFTGWNTYRVFVDYIDAWKYAEEVYNQTGNVIAVEAVY